MKIKTNSTKSNRLTISKETNRSASKVILYLEKELIRTVKNKMTNCSLFIKMEKSINKTIKQI